MSKITTYSCLVICSLIVSCLFTQPVYAAINEPRSALVIGNANYEYGKLRNTLNDADAIAAILKKSGFKVLLKKDCNRRQFISAIKEFRSMLSNGGVSLFYYSGHGMQINGLNYLQPIATKLTTIDEVEFECVNADRVLKEMEGAPTRLDMVILDACRNNPWSGSKGRVRGLAPMLGGKNTMISYATAANEVAIVGLKNERYSPYVVKLLTYLQTPNLNVTDVFSLTSEAVRNSTNNKQVPWISYSGHPRFNFATTEESDIPTTPDIPTYSPQYQQPTIPTPEPPFSESPDMVFVKGGTFQMGDTFGSGSHDEKPVHEVTLDDFYIDKYEVTQKEYMEVIGENPSYFKNCDDCPVENITWNDAKDYCEKVGKRLSTEAEWE